MAARESNSTSGSFSAAQSTAPQMQKRSLLPYGGFDTMPIAGEWRPGNAGRRLTDRNPYTGETLLEIPQASTDDLDAAYAAAVNAQPAWAALTPSARSSVLMQAAETMAARREEIIQWLIDESGSTRLKANLEWESTHAVMLWAAALPHSVESKIVPTDIRGKESQVRRKPVGVVGMISPWNWPLHLSNRTIAPALAVGNAVVVKPASDTPVTGGLLLAKIFEEAGLPSGLLSVIVVTGSTAVGRTIAELAAKATIIKRVDLELGGNGPFVVLADADLEQAAEAAAFGKFLHQGQICIAINRIIVEEKNYDRFVELFLDRVRSLKAGDPNDPETIVGPIINETQLERIMQLIKSARDQGAKQVLGGEPQGLVVPPHVFTNVTNEMEIATREIFGPVAPIVRVRNRSEALAVANDTEYGLAGAVFTRDMEAGMRFAGEMQVGMAHVNDQPVVDLPTAPFGGEKNSGIGRFNGTWAIEAFTTDQWVSMQHTARRYPWNAGAVQGPWS